MCTQPLTALQLSAVQEFPSSQPGAGPATHVPPAHASPTLHTLPSLQETVLFACLQPDAARHVSVVHVLPSSQFKALPGWHWPPAHASPLVHKLPSLHGAGLLVCVQPLAGTQASVVHGLPSSQLGAAPPTHVPPLHWSFNVQAELSSHAIVLLLCVHPLAGLQLSVVQTLLSSQSSVLPGMQLPPEQVSVVLHALPSVHAAPSALLCWQPATLSHVSVVHGLPSLQEMAEPAWHEPPAHTSPTVHTLPSSHGAMLLVLVQPLPASQLSVVHGLPSSQVLGAVGVHTPPLQVSPTVQLLLSLQGTVFGVCWQPAVLSHESSVQGLPSSHEGGAPPMQPPSPHLSMVVHTSPSLHGRLLFTCWQPVAAMHESVVHGLPSSQSFCVPGSHWPALHASPVVHALLSVHGAVLSVCTQPLAALQVSSVQGLPSLQPKAAPGTHTPPPHTSLTVQALSSLHGDVLLTCWQPPAALQVSVVHGLLSSHASAGPGTQPPPLHVSVVVQALPSLHAAVLFTCWHPSLASQESLVQPLPSSHDSAAPATQLPPLHASPCVHTDPSSQDAALFECVQPLAGLQSSLVQTWPSSQFSAAPGTQPPPEQTSPLVHLLPSVHVTVLARWMQPLVASQESSVHGLPSSHPPGLPGTQLPPAQVSPNVQTLPSVHAKVLFTWPQPPPGLQVSVVQGLLSSQPNAAPGTQLPPEHASPTVQELLSVQGAVLNACWQPVDGKHVSSVHTLPSSQTIAGPGTHLPAAQTSPCVQTLSSVQGAVLSTWTQPLAASQESVVHTSLSSQLRAEPGTHLPAAH